MMSDDVHDPDELSELERALVSQLRRRSQQAPVQAVSRGGVETRVAERAAARRRHRSVARGAWRRRRSPPSGCWPCSLLLGPVRGPRW